MNWDSHGIKAGAQLWQICKQEWAVTSDVGTKTTVLTVVKGHRLFSSSSKAADGNISRGPAMCQQRAGIGPAAARSIQELSFENVSGDGNAVNTSSLKYTKNETDTEEIPAQMQSGIFAVIHTALFCPISSWFFLFSLTHFTTLLRRVSWNAAGLQLPLPPLSALFTFYHHCVRRPCVLNIMDF